MSKPNVIPGRDRWYKTTFIQYVAKKNHVSLEAARAAYDMIVPSIVSAVEEGHDVSLTGIGVFFLQRHKGHKTQFGDKGKWIGDYLVLKFSASPLINHRFRDKIKSLDA